jgi:hypothetical protein
LGPTRRAGLARTHARFTQPNDTTLMFNCVAWIDAIYFARLQAKAVRAHLSTARAAQPGAVIAASTAAHGLPATPPFCIDDLELALVTLGSRNPHLRPSPAATPGQTDFSPAAHRRSQTPSQLHLLQFCTFDALYVDAGGKRCNSHRLTPTLLCSSAPSFAAA